MQIYAHKYSYVSWGVACSCDRPSHLLYEALASGSYRMHNDIKSALRDVVAKGYYLSARTNLAQFLLPDQSDFVGFVNGL